RRGEGLQAFGADLEQGVTLDLRRGWRALDAGVGAADLAHDLGPGPAGDSRLHPDRPQCFAVLRGEIKRKLSHWHPRQQRVVEDADAAAVRVGRGRRPGWAAELRGCRFRRWLDLEVQEWLGRDPAGFYKLVAIDLQFALER